MITPLELFKQLKTTELTIGRCFPSQAIYSITENMKIPCENCPISKLAIDSRQKSLGYFYCRFLKQRIPAVHSQNVEEYLRFLIKLYPSILLEIKE